MISTTSEGSKSTTKTEAPNAAAGRSTREWLQKARGWDDSAWDGAAASDGALLVGMERHLDLGSHRSQQLTRALVESADLIFAMGPHHLERVEALGGGEKAYLLTEYPRHGAAGRGISDPMGAELEVYRATADELEREIRRVFDHLAAERVPGAS